MAMNSNYTFLPNPTNCLDCHRDDGLHSDRCKRSRGACQYCFRSDKEHSTMCIRAPGACQYCFHSDKTHSDRCPIVSRASHDSYHNEKGYGDDYSTKRMEHIIGVNQPKHICRITGEPLSKHMYHITGVLLPTRR
jgi:hypothetical protein